MRNSLQEVSPPLDSKLKFVERSALYQEFIEEREEILRHKWHLSEQAGHDVGFERALLDWIRNHRDPWRAKRREQKIISAEPLNNDKSIS